FPDVRLKRFLEMRGADGGPWHGICALPAFWVGLLYDETALSDATNLVADWDFEQVNQLREAVPAKGLAAEIAGKPLLEHARSILDISRAGLASRARENSEGFDETVFLIPLEETIASGKTPAERMLDRYHGQWNGDIMRVFEEYAF
ncbi:MAG: glutamate-cysteine ligase family protein, partial [Pseudomonadota bacterium]